MKRIGLLLVALLAVESTFAQVDKNNLKKKQLLAAGVLGGGTPTFNPIASLQDYALWVFSAHNLSQMYEENSTTGEPTTMPTADGDPIGMVNDYSKYQRRLTTASNASRPTLSLNLKYTGQTLVKFTAASNTRFTLADSRQYLSPMIGSNPIFQIIGQVVLGSSSDGVARTFFDCRNGTNANNGFALQKTSGNKLRFTGSRNSPSTSLYDYTTTASLLEGDEDNYENKVVTFLITVNGSGTNKGSIRIGGGAVETFNITAGVDERILFSDLIFGQQQDQSNDCDDYFQFLGFYAGNHITEDIYQEFLTWTPARSTSPVVIERQKFLFARATKYKDTALTQPVTSENDKVAVVLPSFTGISGWPDINALVAHQTTLKIAGTSGSFRITIDGTNYDSAVGEPGTITSSWVNTNVAAILTNKNCVVWRKIGPVIVDFNDGMPRLYFYQRKLGVAAPVITYSVLSGDLVITEQNDHAPLWKPSRLTGALYFDKTRWCNLELQKQYEPVGNRTYVFVVRNKSDQPGYAYETPCHYLTGNISSGAERDLLVGDNYAGNAAITGSADTPYHTRHLSSDIDGTTTSGLRKNQPWNVFVTIQENGTTKFLFDNKDGVADMVTDATTGTFDPRHIGLEQDGELDVPSSQMEGDIERFIFYTGAMSESEAEALRQQIKTELGI